MAPTWLAHNAIASWHIVVPVVQIIWALHLELPAREQTEHHQKVRQKDFKAARFDRGKATLVKSSHDLN